MELQIPDFVLKRLGLEVARNQLLEEQLAESQETVQKLSDALELQGKGLEVTEEGVDPERLADAMALVKPDAETA